eukprot:3867327-Pleurochrysis_carterae.AAC.1
MTIIGEMLAARKVAELKRVITFGVDETTKFQVGTFSTNVQGETTDGRVVDIVMLCRAALDDEGTGERRRDE